MGSLYLATVVIPLHHFSKELHSLDEEQNEVASNMIPVKVLQFDWLDGDWGPISSLYKPHPRSVSTVKATYTTTQRIEKSLNTTTINKHGSS